MDMSTATATKTTATINGKSYRIEEVTDFSGTYNAFIPCSTTGGNVDRCQVCGGHADHSAPTSCGLG
jgi:hypothetical protein